MRAHFTDEDTKLLQLLEGKICLNQSDTPQLFSPDTRMCLPGYSSQGPHFWVISYPPWLQIAVRRCWHGWLMWLQDWPTLQGKVTQVKPGASCLASPQQHCPWSCPFNQGTSWEGPCSGSQQVTFWQPAPEELGTVPQTTHHRSWRLKTTG